MFPKHSILKTKRIRLKYTKTNLMAKDPAFLFYPNDFVTGTMFFTDEQVGKYLRLLCAQHQHGHLSEKQIIHIIKVLDVDIMEKFTQDDLGLYFNEKLEGEITKRKVFSDSRRSNRMKSTTSDSTSDSTSDKHMSPHMENENENENEKEKVIKNEVKKEQPIEFPSCFDTDAFKTIWELWVTYKKNEHKFNYKTNQTKLAALNNLKTLSNGNEYDAIKIIEQSISNGWKGFFTLKNYNDAKTGTTIGKQTGISQLISKAKNDYEVYGRGQTDSAN